MRLNSAQKRAVEHVDGPCMVLAGPGSGKTRVISYRLKYLVEKARIPPTRILAISFTKASSLEMKKRTCSMDTTGLLSKINYGTFHSVFFRILRKYRGLELTSVLDEGTKRELIAAALREAGVESYNMDTIETLATEISYVKNELVRPESFSSTAVEGKFVDVYHAYDIIKRQRGHIDFDDMLIDTYKLLKENEGILSIVRSVFKYILIDEFQDINRVQFDIIRLIAAPENNVFVVGDEDQSIYAFRGSRPDFLLRFKDYFKGSETVVLDVNYRSDKRIIGVSNKLIRNNKKRYPKVLKGATEEKGKVKISQPANNEREADYFVEYIDEGVKQGASYSDYSIIFRTNHSMRATIDALLRASVPFTIKDSISSFYSHWACSDVISYLKVSRDLRLNMELSNIINKPFRFISKGKVSEAAKSEDFFKCIIEDSSLKDYQTEPIAELRADLEYLGGIGPMLAVSYVRTSLDYDRYVLEYCTAKGMPASQIYDVLDELESAAMRFDKIDDFLRHISMIKSGDYLKVSQDSRDAVTLLTMHGSKGLEFKNVIIAKAIDGVIPHLKATEGDGEQTSDSMEEERRLMYVAMTRAKESLLISVPKDSFGKKTRPSIFVDEILEGKKILETKRLGKTPKRQKIKK